ncbi:glycoside hydrolase family 3 N-terminal domain-containing protein [Actinomyces capricornis]|uniref:Glycosyl hydrolase n=1 Tax=Actinomyces capricornis TaxID=2755559 RepID=A0ABN6K4S4_9ACTO|nr:glycoside hydrolase family 3 N-terminal domain-containing protein [Actinomyces capricornis]BDA64553.1 glycosyl hydrolase [Actinomyces capricornis]
MPTSHAPSPEPASAEHRTSSPAEHRTRAARLVAQMTLEEKASLTSGADFWHLKAIERLGIPQIMVTDGPHGLRKQATAAGQADLSASVPATCFPTAAALGSTWDPELIEAVGRALGAETAANDVAVILGPGVNMKRSPLCGRNFEYFAEDPLLAGRIGAALITGIQSQGVGACLKHYAANNQETDRMRVDVRVSQRALREIYLPAFEHIVRTVQPWSLMCSYNRINGTYASQDPWLLSTVLRQEWGFEGLVVSDWGAVNERVPGLAAGLDLEMPASGGLTDAQIVEAVRQGRLAEEALDTAVERIITLILRTAPALEAARVTADGYDAQAHHALARRVAAEGTVLLKNEPVGPDAAPALPLEAGSFSAQRPLALIGEFARTPRYQGAGSSTINPTRLDTALEAFTQALGEEAVAFTPGYHLAEAAGKEGQELSARALREEAVEVARGATAVLLVGLPQIDESEGYDRPHMGIPAEQVALVRAVSQVAASTIVVVVGGSAVDLSWDDNADALAIAWLGGQAGGSAIADVVLGVQAPSGHLAETLPRRLSDLPAQLNFPGHDSVVDYGEGVFIGYRAMDAMEREVAYPFGHGLTYTGFALSDVRVRPIGRAGQDTAEVQAHGPVGPADAEGQARVLATVHATVTNTGQRPGAQVVQVYVGRTGASAIQRAPRELRGFTKVHLEAGQSIEIELPLTQRDLSFWDEPCRAWVVEAGGYEVSVGFSSRDLPAVLPLEVQAPAPVRELRPDSTLGEWLAHPVGGLLMEEALAGTLARLRQDHTTFEMMAATPANRLVAMPGMDLDPPGYRALLDRARARQERPEESGREPSPRD